MLVEPVLCSCTVGHVTACCSRHDNDFLLTLRRLGPKSDRRENSSSIVHSALAPGLRRFPLLHCAFGETCAFKHEPNKRGNGKGRLPSPSPTGSTHRNSKGAERAISQQPQAGSDPELILHTEHTMPKAATKLAAALNTPQASISKTPVVVHNSSIPTTSN